MVHKYQTVWCGYTEIYTSACNCIIFGIICEGCLNMYKEQITSKQNETARGETLNSVNFHNIHKHVHVYSWCSPYWHWINSGAQLISAQKLGDIHTSKLMKPKSSCSSVRRYLLVTQIPDISRCTRGKGFTWSISDLLLGRGRHLILLCDISR